MKRMTAIVQRIVAGVMAAGMVLALMPSLAMADSARIVTLGANLNASERAEVLKFFGLTESDLNKMVVVTVTNADERAQIEFERFDSALAQRRRERVATIARATAQRNDGRREARAIQTRRERKERFFRAPRAKFRDD